MTRRFLAILLLVLSARCVTASRAKSLDALLSRYEAEGFSGTVLVAKNDRIILHKGYGLADRARRIPNGTATLFEIASLTKTFTAAAILQLESNGKLQTTDVLSRYLGAFPAPKDKATIEHLATHTAGLVPDGFDLGEGTDREQFIEAVKRAPAESVPGEKYRYTNAGYSVLGAIIENVSGVDFETYLRNNVFNRAGLRDVYFRDSIPDAVRSRMALGYMGADAAPTEPPPLRWGTHAAGGAIATVGEVYRWHVAVRTGRVINADGLRKMFMDRPEDEGYAWHVQRDKSGRRMLLKGGGMPQYATQIIEYPDDRIVIIWATNSLQKRWRQDLNRGIAEVMLGDVTAP